jgi:hypothetical protein
MISDSQNKALLIVAEKAAESRDWLLFAEYCRLREKGLRKQAFEKMSAFLKEFREFSFERKKNFADFIFRLADSVPDADYGPLPTPLSAELKPVLLEWTEHESRDSNPFRWMGRYGGDFSYLDKALEIDPTDDKARIIIIGHFLDIIWHSTHHLPHYYIGDPRKTLKNAARARAHIEKLTDKESQELWRQELDSSLRLVLSYVDWRKSESDLDFKTWGEKNIRDFDSGIKAFYYDQNE